MKENQQHQIFEEWLDKYRALIFKIIRAYASHTQARDDLFQSICLQVWRSIPKFRGECSETTWIYRIALNTAMSWSTKERRFETNHQDIEGMDHLLVEKDLEKDDRLTWLYQEISKLNEIDRSITLLLLDGLSYKEMAQILGISESNLGVKIHRIKKHLTSASEKYDYHGI